MASFSREDHEQGLALFLTREHRPRFLDALGDERLRAKLREKLPHFAWLDECLAEPTGCADSGEVARRLRAAGAGETCVVIADDDELDGRELPLDEALRRVHDDDVAALVSCVPGRLAFFSAEPPHRELRIMRR